MSRIASIEAALEEVGLAREENRWANLAEANLAGVNLAGANLSHADLHRANLHRTDLYGANLSNSNLHWANLTGAILQGANLNAKWILTIQTPSGRLIYVPTPHGWELQIGCWRNHTVEDLKQLLDAPTGLWPGADEGTRPVREKFLRACLPLLKLHTEMWGHMVPTLQEIWGTS